MPVKALLFPLCSKDPAYILQASGSPESGRRQNTIKGKQVWEGASLLCNLLSMSLFMSPYWKNQKSVPFWGLLGWSDVFLLQLG